MSNLDFTNLTLEQIQQLKNILDLPWLYWI
jgi:hypothetical protein